MSLKEQALSIKNETVSKSITPDRLGTFLEESAKVTETVDTIAALRAFDTTQLQVGDIVRTKSHTIAPYGGNKFIWDTEELFSYNGASAATHDGSSVDGSVYTVTPIKQGFWADAGDGQKIVFEGGATAIATVNVKTSSAQTDTPKDVGTRAYGVGETEVRLILNGTIQPGEKAFYADDNGSYIRPNYTGFNSIGVFKVIAEDGFLGLEDFGCIPNYSIEDGPINECSALIQNALDSDININISGNYYFNSTLYWKRRKVCTMNGTPFETFGSGRRRYGHWGRGRGCLYTDQDIDGMVLHAGGSLDCYIDMSKAVTNKRAFVQDFTYNVAIRANFKVQGNPDQLLVSEDSGVIAFELDDLMSPALGANDGPGSNTGSLSFSYVNVNAQACHKVVSAIGTNARSNWTNTVFFNIVANGCKKGYDWGFGNSNGAFTGAFQSGDVYPTTPDYAVNYVSGEGAYVNIYCHDLGKTGRPTVGTELGSSGMLLGPATKQNSIGNKFLLQGGETPELTNSKVFIPKSGGFGAPDFYISRMDNPLLFFNKRGTVTVDLYDGSTYNFETQLTESSALSPASNLSIQSPTKFVDPTQGVNATWVDWGTGANLDTDFIEIVYTGSHVRADGKYFVTVSGGLKKIQVIEWVGATSQTNIVDVPNFSGSRTVQVDLPGDIGDPDKIIVRLIGALTEGQRVALHDIAYRKAKMFDVVENYIHRGGGQRIHGSLEMDELILPQASVGTVAPAPLIQRRIFDISSTQILNSNTNPIILMDISGQRPIVPKGIYFGVTGGSTNYNTNTSFVLKSSNHLFGTDTPYTTLDLSNISPHKQSMPITDRPFRSANTNIFLTTLNGNPVGGDKSLQLVLDYVEVF